MRKRLRKKKHLREFRVYGANIRIELREEARFDIWLDEFLEYIEANDCRVGGGGAGCRFKAFVELGTGFERAKRALAATEVWLASSENVEGYEAGPLIDANTLLAAPMQ